MTLHPINPDAGLYGVESDNPKRSGHTYTVSIKDRTCTCPASLYRNARCKHVQVVEAFLANESKLQRALLVAEGLSDADLKKWAELKRGTPAGCACLLELAARAATAQPKPIPPGVLELLQGATDAEKARALEIYG